MSDRSVLINDQLRFRLLYIFLIANEKFMDVFVRGPTKSRVPGPHVGKSARL